MRDRNAKLCWSRRLVSKPNASLPELGQRIRIRRKTIGMTQAQLASSIGISFQQMQKYEKGINAISSTRLAQICDVLSLPHDFFETTASPLIGKAEPVDGYGSNPSEETIRRFLDSGEGQRLIASFMRIVDKRLRTRILDFVASIADD